MAFNRAAVKNDFLYVTINGQRKTMKVSDMTDLQLKTALGRADNANALAPGWSVNAQGNVVYAQPVPVQPNPTNTSGWTGTSTPTPTSGGGGGGPNVGTGGPAEQPIVTPVIDTPVITPTTPITLGPSQAQIAAAQQGVRTAVAPINAQIADLQANNWGKFNSRQQIIGRDQLQGKHDYNAQSAGAGFRRSGGVRTNNKAVDANAFEAGQQNFNTFGQGAVNNLGLQKNALVRQTIEGLLGGFTTGLNQSIYEGY